MGQIEIAGDHGRGTEVCQLSGETKFQDPLTFAPSDRGRRCRRWWYGIYGTEPEKQSWMRFVHFENASLQIEYSQRRQN
jgi:hypothetical protein